MGLIFTDVVLIKVSLSYENFMRSIFCSSCFKVFLKELPDFGRFLLAGEFDGRLFLESNLPFVGGVLEQVIGVSKTKSIVYSDKNNGCIKI